MNIIAIKLLYCSRYLLTNHWTMNMNNIYKTSIYGLHSSLWVKTMVLWLHPSVKYHNCSHLGPIVLTRASHGRIDLYNIILWFQHYTYESLIWNVFASLAIVSSADSGAVNDSCLQMGYSSNMMCIKVTSKRCYMLLPCCHPLVHHDSSIGVGSRSKVN